MYLARLTLGLFVTAITWGCTRNEPSLVPLGHGPLSQKERQSDTAHDDSRRASNSNSPNEVPSQPAAPGPTQHEERSSQNSSPEPASSAATSAATDAPSLLPKAGAPKTAQEEQADWLGLYRGSDTTTFRLPEQPERSFDDSKAKIRVEQSAKGRLQFALVDSSNDRDICQLSASVEGNVATIDAGQACFLDSDDELEVRSRPGKATRTARQLVFDLVLDTTMDSEAGKLDGTIEYHFEGRR